MESTKDYIWGDATTLKCGCIFEETEVGYIMHWCPKHKATDDMYEALKRLSIYPNDHYGWELAEQALAKVEKK